MADNDLLDELRQYAKGGGQSSPPNAPSARSPDEHLLDELRQFATPPPPPRGDAGTSPSSGHYDPAMVLAKAVREAHGHGAGGTDSWGDVATRAWGGTLRGVGDFADTVGAGITHSTDYVANALANRGYISPETAAGITQWRNRADSLAAEGRHAWDEADPQTAGLLGRVGGEIVSTAPVLGVAGKLGEGALGMVPGGSAVAANLAARFPWLTSFGRGAATGATSNLLTSAGSDAPLGEQVGWGAGVGGLLGPIGRFAGHLVGGAADRETANLAELARNKYGIPVRIDQISGNPMARFGGSVAQRMPGTGLAANVAEQQGAFNRAIANTFGETADRITPDVMARARGRIGNAFDTTLPKLEAHLNPKVSGQLTAIDQALPYLPAEDARIIANLKNNIVGQFGVSAVGRMGTARAPMNGRQIQSLITTGSPLDRAINGGGSANVRYYAGQLKDILLDAVGQTGTGRAKRAAAYVDALNAFRNARFQYKNMKTIEDLVEKSPTGDISPPLLMNQVRGSFGNMAYGGGSDLADLARIGQRFLKEPPSSGTAERLAMMKLGTAAAAGVTGAYALDPDHVQRDVLALGAILAAGRAGGSILRSGPLARAAIRGGQRTSPPILPPVLSAGLPFLAPRSNPMLPPPGSNGTTTP